MRIKCNLSIYMGQKKWSIQDVCNQTGLARNTVGKLYHESATRIDYETIVKLCDLFKIGIGELFELAD